MGYDQTSRRRTYELKFRPYPGLTVRCRKPGFTALELLSGAVLALGDDFSGDGLAVADQLRHWRGAFCAFADSLVGWDLADIGVPVPATRDGVLAQDHEFLITLVRTWYHVVVIHQNIKPERTDGSRVVSNANDISSADDVESLLADVPVTVASPEPVSA